MSTTFSYRQYVTDDHFLDEYNEYQLRYASQMRESDKALIDIVREIVRKQPAGERLELLDVGCSTGNLLLHLKRLVPELSLSGGDLAESSLSACRANPDLGGVNFALMDLLHLPKAQYDIITVNAVLYMMEDSEFEAALRSIAGALRPGGTMIAFDFFHKFPQDLHIIESSRSHPGDLRLRFRPIELVEPLLVAAGFSIPDFRPFMLPMDLPPADDAAALVSYTITADSGRRLAFRGTLYQPWCYLVATRR